MVHFFFWNRVAFLFIIHSSIYVFFKYLHSLRAYLPWMDQIRGLIRVLLILFSSYLSIQPFCYVLTFFIFYSQTVLFPLHQSLDCPGEFLDGNHSGSASQTVQPVTNNGGRWILIALYCRIVQNICTNMIIFNNHFGPRKDNTITRANSSGLR